MTCNSRDNSRGGSGECLGGIRQVSAGSPGDNGPAWEPIRKTAIASARLHREHPNRLRSESSATGYGARQPEKPRRFWRCRSTLWRNAIAGEASGGFFPPTVILPVASHASEWNRRPTRREVRPSGRYTTRTRESRVSARLHPVTGLPCLNRFGRGFPRGGRQAGWVLLHHRLRLVLGSLFRRMVFDGRL
jgi:hypothetical protein